MLVKDHLLQSRHAEGMTSNITIWILDSSRVVHLVLNNLCLTSSEFRTTEIINGVPHSVNPQSTLAVYKEINIYNILSFDINFQPIYVDDLILST